MSVAEKLRELMGKASARPWEDDPDESTIEGPNGGAICHVAHHVNTWTVLSRKEEWSHADAALIVSAVNALPELLAPLEMLARQPEDKLLTPNGRLCVLCGRGPYAFPEMEHAETCPWWLSRVLCGVK